MRLPSSVPRLSLWWCGEPPALRLSPLSQAPPLFPGHPHWTLLWSSQSRWENLLQLLPASPAKWPISASGKYSGFPSRRERRWMVALADTFGETLEAPCLAPLLVTSPLLNFLPGALWSTCEKATFTWYKKFHPLSGFPPLLHQSSSCSSLLAQCLLVFAEVTPQVTHPNSWKHFLHDSLLSTPGLPSFMLVWSHSSDMNTQHVCVLVTQLCLTLCNPLDCSPPGSYVHGILRARILEWVAVPFFRGSQPWDRTQISRIAGEFFTDWATREAQTHSTHANLRGLTLTPLTWLACTIIPFLFWTFGSRSSYVCSNSLLLSHCLPKPFSPTGVHLVLLTVLSQELSEKPQPPNQMTVS